MRIGVIVPDLRPNPLYRALMPTGALAKRGHTVGTAVVDGPRDLPPFEAFLDFDVVYFWRMYYAPLRRLATALQRAGKAVIWDNDDDLTTVPRGSANYRHVGGIHGQRAWVEMQAMVKLADAVTTPSQRLAERYRGLGQPNVHVIENYLPGVTTRPAGNRDRIVVGWVAAGEHSTDVRPLRIRESVRALLDACLDVYVETVGVTLELNDRRYRRTTIIPLADLPAQIARFDIGIAPLSDTAFNRSRSNIKLKEYAGAGVPWLASPVGAYAGLGERQGGRLVEDGRWAEALVDLVRDGNARRQLARNAHEWARGETIDRNVDRWERILADAVERAASRRR